MLNGRKIIIFLFVSFVLRQESVTRHVFCAHSCPSSHYSRTPCLGATVGVRVVCFMHVVPSALFTLMKYCSVPACGRKFFSSWGVISAASPYKNISLPPPPLPVGGGGRRGCGSRRNSDAARVVRRQRARK